MTLDAQFTIYYAFTKYTHQTTKQTPTRLIHWRSIFNKVSQLDFEFFLFWTRHLIVEEFGQLTIDNWQRRSFYISSLWFCVEALKFFNCILNVNGFSFWMFWMPKKEMEIKCWILCLFLFCVDEFGRDFKCIFSELE